MMLSYLVRLLTNPGGRGRVLKTITKAVVMAALFCALPLVAQAAGLGRLTLLSALGQPLNAEVEIVSLQLGEEDLSARLASPQAFAQAGIDPDPILSDVRFSIERRGGVPILRLRSSQPINVDVRILAATHQDLEAMIASGRFREDLYYRINVFPLRTPSLRA